MKGGGHMCKNNHFRTYKDESRRNLLKYTRKAFRMIPGIKNPDILDIGCGSGIPTVELAKLSGGKVIGWISIRMRWTDSRRGFSRRVFRIGCLH